jgi:hypothetical protein
MLLISSLSLVFWRELASGEPQWWPWFTSALIILLFALTLVRANLKPLRGFVFMLLVIFFLGFGGGWEWGLIPFIRASSVWVSWERQAPWALSALATHLLRLTPALTILSFLLLTGHKRQDFFLVKGKIDAPVEQRARALGLGSKKPEPWTRTGSIFAIIFTTVTFVYMMQISHPSLSDFLQALPLLPVALFIAVINAFNEEFTLRAAPLSQLWATLGKQQALMITTAFFGLGHFYGIPSGVLGVLLSSFLGWFLGKSMLETRGFFWAWLIHFLPDAFIFTFLAISG